MRTRIAALGLVAPLALVGTACGGDGDDTAGSEAELDEAVEQALDDAASGSAATDISAAPPAEMIDTCPLLSTAEIEAQYGERGAIGPADGELGEGTCRWQVGENFAADGGWVFVSHYPVAGMDPQDGLEMMAAGAEAPEPLDGLGDDAIVSDEGTEVLVWFLHGTDVLAVSSRFEQPPTGLRDRVMALAELVEERT